MSTATLTTPLPHAGRPADTGGWGRRAWERLVAARSAQARRVIAAHLRTLDPATLASYGFSADEIRKLRGGVIVTAPDKPDQAA